MSVIVILVTCIVSHYYISVYVLHLFLLDLFFKFLCVIDCLLLDLRLGVMLFIMFQLLTKILSIMIRLYVVFFLLIRDI